MKSILYITLVVMFAGCSNSVNDQSYQQQIEFYDQSNAVICEATLSYSIQTDSTIKGSYRITKGSLQYASQNSVNELIGFLYPNSFLSLNLNPRWADAGTGMYGNLANNKFDGNWDYISIAGSVPGGKFKTVSRSNWFLK